MKINKLISILWASSILIVSTNAMASAFQLWEQDGASIANYHAGYAALAQDASTAWYNPAGIIRIKNQQLVLGAVAITTSFKYRGDVTLIEPPLTKTFTSVTSQGGNFSLIPDLHYVAPITDTIGFGFSIDVPFGLKTDYGRNSPLRYAATLTSISVVDYSPSLGIQITDQASIGFGFDIQKLDAEFDSVGFLISVPQSDTDSINHINGTGYGYHIGALYQFTPCSRVGLSYHSQVRHHLSGSSKFVGPMDSLILLDHLPDIVFNRGPFDSSRATANLTLPPYTALSGYHEINPKIAIMGSLIYTQWNLIRNLIFNNYAGAVANPMVMIALSKNIQVVVPQHYRNTWNASVGVDYHATEQITLRGGLGYDQTPVSNAYRNVQLPDNNRYIIAMGGHYQASPAFGFDLGWTHLFMSQAHVNPPPQAMGGQTVVTNGRVSGGADVYGAQLTWNM